MVLQIHELIKNKVPSARDLIFAILGFGIGFMVDLTVKEIYKEALISWIYAHGIAIREWMVAFGTIFLAIMAYYQVKASYKQISESRLQRRIETHSKDLKQLFRDWNEELTNISQYKVPYLIDEPSYKIEEDVLFEDSKMHILSLQKFGDFDKIWQDYKEKAKEVYQRQTEIIDKIQTDDKITEFLNNFWSNIENKKRSQTIQDISKSVYLQAGCIVACKICKNYSNDYFTKNHLLSDLYYSHPSLKNKILLAENKGENNFEPQKHHENICNQIVSEYKDDFKKIIDFENELIILSKNMTDKLKMLIRYPEYDKMDCCEWVKRSGDL